jgi:autophagy-related protein 9
MADYSAIHPSPFARRRFSMITGAAPGHDHPYMTGTTAALGGEHKNDPAERSKDYDRALRASQMVRSRFQPGAASLYQSGMAGMSMAQTAVLGDSEGGGNQRRDAASPPVVAPAVLAVPRVELGADGVVDSELGESYVDGVVRRPKPYGVSQSQQEEEEELEDGGVLGLLAQIYGRNAKGQRPGI